MLQRHHRFLFIGMSTSNNTKSKGPWNKRNQVITIEHAKVLPSPCLIARTNPPTVTPEVARVLTFKSFVRTFQFRQQNKDKGSSTWFQQEKTEKMEDLILMWGLLVVRMKLLLHVVGHVIPCLQGYCGARGARLVYCCSPLPPTRTQHANWV